MASRGDKGNGNGEEQIVEVNRCGLHYLTVYAGLISLLNGSMLADVSRGVSLLHLHGETG